MEKLTDYWIKADYPCPICHKIGELSSHESENFITLFCDNCGLYGGYRKNYGT